MDVDLDAKAAEQDKFTVAATADVKLKADSGYTSHETARVSADQWTRICGILAEPNEATT